MNQLPENATIRQINKQTLWTHFIGHFNENYSQFLEKISTDKNLVLLELGVGFNTPVIIRYPFEQITFDNPNVTLIRLNRSHYQAIPQNRDKTISFDEDISEVFDYWLSRI